MRAEHPPSSPSKIRLNGMLEPQVSLLAAASRSATEHLWKWHDARMFRRCVCCSILIFVTPSFAADSIDAAVEQFQKQNRVPRISIAVVERGRITKSAAYGLASIEHEVPATTRTLFRTDSTNKLLTAVAIMQLAEAGKLKLDDSVSRYLDGTPTEWKDVTIRHLLTHTSGIHDEYSEVFHGSELVDYKVADLWDHARKQPLESPPGTQAKYCNLGYFVLTLIVERAAGMPYVRYMQDHILSPAGMKDASYADKEVVASFHALGTCAWNAGSGADCPIRNTGKLSPQSAKAVGRISPP
jgi:CubicO group peptidase (beta-lactamase class C family)